VAGSGSVGILRPAAVLRYLREMDTVDGWCSPTTGLAMAELLWQQERDGVSGGIAEIGVHHGKSFLFLALAARPGDRLVAIDLFERQKENIDASGHGDRQRFHETLRRFAPGVSVEEVTASSQELWELEEKLKLRGLRFLSIDGGHTRELTLNDLRLADALLGQDGLCVVDDVLSSHWTGVISGIFEFLNNDPGLVPCAIIPNKLLLARSERQEHWRNVLRAVLGHNLEKSDMEFGRWKIDIFGGISPDDWSIQNSQALSALGTAESRLQSLADEILALKTSTSWRVTAPLRRLARYIRR
jgi:cephalosporin hydroxylase